MWSAGHFARRRGPHHHSVHTPLLACAAMRSWGKRYVRVGISGASEVGTVRACTHAFLPLYCRTSYGMEEGHPLG
ncbi:hypothetical protein WN55_06505 [Dufourea novaeangliae]|uniref:Uncharacterized protein n=1 Tax=Dufourea novaeangliae TaxID=178035 RepID=A0A154PRJ9_DUFNO|nr:hypothetical protein WN55_06505 [Dufourea novaeangliae]